MKDYYEKYWAREMPPPATDRDAPKRASILWGLAAKFVTPGARVVECGSGQGDIVAAAEERGYEAVGFEISDVAISIARRRHGTCEYIRHSAEVIPWPFPDQSADLVVSFEVIEHLVAPNQLLKGAFQVLRPGGYLAVTTPYHGLAKNLALSIRGFDRHFDVEGEHLRFFTDAALARMFVDAGFVRPRFYHFGRCWSLWSGVFVWAQKA
jgi:2-polyprenyl-6-hydroxyphenyl methylase/3-demethylubiquinone-9 3-methyltransferase